MESNPMTYAELEHFNDSLTRCTSDSRFLERFSALFLASSDEVRHKFSQTDMPKQRRLLQASFHMMMLAATSDPVGTAHFERLAVLHSQSHLDIPPHLYDLWLDCLVQAVRESDPQCTPETESVWRSMMANGIAFMKARYQPKS
jgi:hemoglobin-like flavoprotein